jgi:hypothetical protein
MPAPTYQYQGEALVLRLEGHGTPAEMHTELLAAISVALQELAESDSTAPGSTLPMLFAVLDALRPTAAHLAQGEPIA